MFRVYIYKCKAPLFVKNSAPWKAFFRKRYPPYFRDRGNYEQCLIIVTRKGGRTGRSTHLCSEPSYTRNHSSLTWVYENVNKSNNRAAKTLFGPIYLPFLCNNHQFCFFLSQTANITGSNCATKGFNVSKKHKLPLYQTQSGERNYVDHKIIF